MVVIAGLIAIVLAVLMLGPLLLERLERRLPPPGRTARPTDGGPT